MNSEFGGEWDRLKMDEESQKKISCIDVGNNPFS